MDRLRNRLVVVCFMGIDNQAKAIASRLSTIYAHKT